MEISASLVTRVIDISAPRLSDHRNTLRDVSSRLSASREEFITEWTRELDQANFVVRPYADWIPRATTILLDSLSSLDATAYLVQVSEWSALWRARGADFAATIEMLSSWRRALLPFLIREYPPGPELEGIFTSLDILERSLLNVMAAAELERVHAQLERVLHTRPATSPANNPPSGPSGDFHPSRLAQWARILVVDDEPMVCEVTARSFQLRGFRTATAASGADAVRVFSEQGPFQVVLVDLGMAEMNGIETVRAIKEMYPRTITILMTGWSDEANSGFANEPAVDGTIPKPFDVEQVIDLVSGKLVSQENF